MIVRSARGWIALCLAVCMGLALAPAWAQEQVPETGKPAEAVFSLLLKKMEWVISDMVRCIEELRRIEDVNSKRLLVEQMEEILYREVEFPMLYQQADNVNALDVAPIGATSDVVDGGEASPLAPLYAQSFVLMGIAKGYEGYSAAASDYIERAREIYGDVLSIKVRIDSFQDPQTLGQWIADARGRWGATTPIRVSFYGKSISQEVVDGLNLENVQFQADLQERNTAYHLQVAKRDFLKGMRRYIVTDDPLTKRRDNRFAVYLPPGAYQMATGVTLEYGNAVEVHTNPNRNHYLIETLEEGIAVYPVPNVRELGKLLSGMDEAEGEEEIQAGGAMTGESPAEAEPAEETGENPEPVEEQADEEESEINEESSGGTDATQ